MKEVQKRDSKKIEVTPPNTVKELLVTITHPTFSNIAASPHFLSTSQIEIYGRTFLQEVLNPQATVFDISGQPVSSQEYFNGPQKDIKNGFAITLLSLCDKSISI